jgi:hypothetical protein
MNIYKHVKLHLINLVTQYSIKECDFIISYDLLTYR